MSAASGLDHDGMIGRTAYPNVHSFALDAVLDEHGLTRMRTFDGCLDGPCGIGTQADLKLSGRSRCP